MTPNDVSTNKPKKAPKPTVLGGQQAFELCVGKTRENVKRLADDPKTAALAVNGNYFEWKEDFHDIGNWTSSFFTGMALVAWRETEDEYFLKQVLRLAPHYREKVFTHFVETMHDLGFLYSLYSVALYKLTGDKQHREVGLRAAEILAERFVPEGQYIRAWGRMDETETDYAGLAIIDCMMNLPLLFWAAKESGSKKLYDIAVAHADTTLKHFVRADDTVFHSFRFDLKTGQALRGDNYCGRTVQSHWARGTAWAIYGFALSYGYTRDSKYLSVSQRLAKKFIAGLDGEVVPIWDFKLAAGETPVRDSSAAAIAVCGFQELAKHHAADGKILKAKDALLERLCSSDYLDTNEKCPGILKKGQIGDGVGVAKSAYTSWGDYYFMEAIARELFQTEGWW
jgi:unsaturated chondroitin disaccharide hydrolase